MLPQTHLAPAHSVPVPAEMRGTRRAIFFLLRYIQPTPQPTLAPILAPRPQRPAPVPRMMDTDTFVFQF